MERNRASTSLSTSRSSSSQYSGNSRKSLCSIVRATSSRRLQTLRSMRSSVEPGAGVRPRPTQPGDRPERAARAELGGALDAERRTRRSTGGRASRRRQHRAAPRRAAGGRRGIPLPQPLPRARERGATAWSPPLHAHGEGAGGWGFLRRTIPADRARPGPASSASSGTTCAMNRSSLCGSAESASSIVRPARPTSRRPARRRAAHQGRQPAHHQARPSTRPSHAAPPDEPVERLLAELDGRQPAGHVVLERGQQAMERPTVRQQLDQCPAGRSPAAARPPNPSSNRPGRCRACERHAGAAARPTARRRHRQRHRRHPQPDRRQVEDRLIADHAAEPERQPGPAASQSQPAAARGGKPLLPPRSARLRPAASSSQSRHEEGRRQLRRTC